MYPQIEQSLGGAPNWKGHLDSFLTRTTFSIGFHSELEMAYMRDSCGLYPREHSPWCITGV
jgi:hypothetical protein